MAAPDAAPDAAPGSNSRLARSNSISQASENSQTAQEFINIQLQLEADAREALPYQFDACTRPLGPLRQILFSCLTCNPPPSSPSEPYTPAGVCYSCSISCHGEHTLVELFSKRNFVCDCGSARIQSDSPCTLRLNDETGTKGGVRSEKAAEGNRYNQNFRNRFCGCGEEYDAHQEKGTMFQCMGLGTVEDGGCGEDWWHPECIAGLGRDWYKQDLARSANQDLKRSVSGEADGVVVATAESKLPADAQEENDSSARIEPGGSTETTVHVEATEQASFETADQVPDDSDPPLPPGFPDEDDFEHLICYKCTDAFPWMKRYAGTAGFLPPLYYRPLATGKGASDATKPASPQAVPGAAQASATRAPTSQEPSDEPSSKKRRAPEDDADAPPKRRRSSSSPSAREPHQPAEAAGSDATTPRHATLPPAPAARLSLFLRAGFREHLCRCAACFPRLARHPPLLEEEETYEPPVSEDGEGAAGGGGGSVGTGSLLERGEAALSAMDRVQALAGVRAYNHVKDQLKPFLQSFADSGRAVGAEDIKAYFAKLRGDTEAMKAAAAGALGMGGGGGEDEEDGGDNRREQSGY